MGDDGDFGMYEQKVVVQEDPIHGQLSLNEQELAADVSKILTAADPNSCSAKCQFQWGTGKFTSMPPSNRDMLAVHFHKAGLIFQRDSDEAKMQVAAQQAAQERLDEEARKLKQAGGDGMGAMDTVVEAGKNQFNYSERAAQTFNAPMRERGVSTEPPPMKVVGENVTQWNIYDTYMDMYQNQLREQAASKQASGGGRPSGSSGAAAASANDKDDDVIHSEAMGRSLKILERMSTRTRRMRSSKTSSTGRISLISSETAREVCCRCGGSLPSAPSASR
jgi:dynein intermediate chain 1